MEATTATTVWEDLAVGAWLASTGRATLDIPGLDGGLPLRAENAPATPAMAVCLRQMHARRANQLQ